MSNRIVKLLKAENSQVQPTFHDFEFLEPGLVSYKDIDRGICNLDKEVIDEMLPTFVGVPLTINHQNTKSGKLENITNGFVVSPYYDAGSGKFRVKFMATTDEAQKKIADGWKVSCAYDVIELGPGGKRNAVPYDQNILKGKFTHLALCPPDKARYEDSTGRTIDSGMMVFNNSIGEGHILVEKQKQEDKTMSLNFKFHFPFTIEKAENSVDPEKTLVEVSKGKNVSVKDLITAYNSRSSETTKSEDVSEDSLLEIVNSKGETEKVTVKDLVAAYNSNLQNSDESEAKKKELADAEEKEAVNAMDDKEKDEYKNCMNPEKKNSMRKNAMERKNAMDAKKKEDDAKETRENAIKVQAQEQAREEAKKNLKTFTVINSKGKILGPEAAVNATTDDGSTRSGAKRGESYFKQKFGTQK